MVRRRPVLLLLLLLLNLCGHGDPVIMVIAATTSELIATQCQLEVSVSHGGQGPSRPALGPGPGPDRRAASRPVAAGRVTDPRRRPPPGRRRPHRERATARLACQRSRPDTMTSANISELGGCTAVHYVHYVHCCALFSGHTCTVSGTSFQ
jgi:hypothetical protein